MKVRAKSSFRLPFIYFWARLLNNNTIMFVTNLKSRVFYWLAAIIVQLKPIIWGFGWILIRKSFKLLEFRLQSIRTKIQQYGYSSWATCRMVSIRKAVNSLIIAQSHMLTFLKALHKITCFRFLLALIKVNCNRLAKRNYSNKRSKKKEVRCVCLLSMNHIIQAKTSLPPPLEAL